MLNLVQKIKKMTMTGGKVEDRREDHVSLVYRGFILR